MTIQLKALTAAIAVAFAGAAFAADKPMDGKHNDGKLSKKEAANASRSDESGFAKMDKNKDGYISKAEAIANKELTGNFGKWDMNNDGKLTVAEFNRLKKLRIPVNEKARKALAARNAGVGASGRR